MQHRGDCTDFSADAELANEEQSAIIDSNHGFPCVQENFSGSDCEQCEMEDHDGTKTINTRKWQITLTSDDCSIKKNCQGWQIYPKTAKAIEEELQLNLRVFDSKMNYQVIRELEPVKTANAEVLCNREDLDDLFGDEEKENKYTHGKIILREYLRLLTTEQAKISFILKVLTKAVNEHKVFGIYGTFPVLRKPLGKRGWVEKRSIRRMLSMSPEMSEAGLESIDKLLRYPSDLVWYTNKRVAVRTDEKTIVNKFSGCYFTSKVDMCNNLENVSWYFEAGVSNIQFPRCYNVYQPAQIEEFVQDFYITACMGTLKWFLFFASLAGPDSVWSPNGIVPIKTIFFALERCAEHISFCTHEDIDTQTYEPVSTADWAQFLLCHEQFIHRREMLKRDGDDLDMENIHQIAADTLKRMIRCRPESRIDGMRNVWIIKPGDKSLGRGIVLKHSLNDILGKISQASKECMQYVVQKYIERPLLVYKTKVDVRQWFLITSTQPLVVWMYKDILLRFASKEFTLENFHESIHLCNTTVQLKYRKTVRPNFQIPSELHWNLENFKEYLKETDRESAWEKLIKPGIKQNLIGALLASQENMVNRKNSFQLYGADFLIMDDLSVWLIEINTNPRLNPPSSSVTEKLYPEVIEDTMKGNYRVFRTVEVSDKIKVRKQILRAFLKVILDRRKNKKAVPGKFECIFKQRSPFHGNTFGQAASLGIRGKALLSALNSSRKP